MTNLIKKIIPVIKEEEEVVQKEKVFLQINLEIQPHLLILGHPLGVIQDQLTTRKIIKPRINKRKMGKKK